MWLYYNLNECRTCNPSQIIFASQRLNIDVVIYFSFCRKLFTHFEIFPAFVTVDTRDIFYVSFWKIASVMVDKLLVFKKNTLVTV